MPVRSLGRKLLLRSSSAAPPPIDDWSEPCLVTSEVAEVAPPPHTTGAAAPPSYIRAAPGGAAVRCLVTTGVLDVGGMDEFVAFLARRLGSCGIATSVLHVGTSIDRNVGPGGRLAESLRAAGVPIADLEGRDGASWLAANRPDVISAHGAPAWVLQAAMASGIPYVETLHGMHSLFGVDWNEEDCRARGVTLFVAVSELVRQQYLAGNSSFPADRIVTIPNGVDTDRLPRVERDAARKLLGLDDEFLFLSLGRHSLQKNSFGLVSAFAEVAQPRPAAHLLISGRVDDPTYAHHVRLLADQLPVRGRIHLRDHFPSPATLLAAADCFVLDSFFEGWPLASMEALYSGVPVVMSEVGGAREQVGEDGERGHLVPNPLGTPLLVDWETIRRAQFAPQTNRSALVAAMASVHDRRDEWLDRRSALHSYCKTTFRDTVCLEQHAQVLRQAALGSRPS